MCNYDNYGNTSNFSLASVHSRYWYFKWYQRWEDGNNTGYNKNLYVNSDPYGDYVFVIEKSGRREEIDALYDELLSYGIMQFVRSGRISVTKEEMKISELLRKQLN